MTANLSERIVNDLISNDIGFVTTVPCKQLAGVIDAIDKQDGILHVPSNKEDEGMGLCAGAYMGGKRPCIIMTFAELGLTEPLLRALKGENYKNPTPIQAQAIPHMLAGEDLLGIAQTGTGKTAAFALPILQNLAALPVPQAKREDGKRKRRPPFRVPQALILAPTRELVLQIEQAIRTYGRHLHLRHTAIYGGVGQRPQVEALRRGVDIIVATPGRLLDLMNQQHLRLHGIRHFVLDEADRMICITVFSRCTRDAAKAWSSPSICLSATPCTQEQVAASISPRA